MVIRWFTQAASLRPVVFLASLIVFAGLAGTARAQSEPDCDSSEVERTTYRCFLRGLVERNGRYLLNGRWTAEPNVRAYHTALKASSAAPASAELAVPEPEVREPIDREAIVTLNVMLSDGKPDLWIEPGSRRLRYAIDTRGLSEARHAALKDALAQAAKDWADACPHCGFVFQHETELDGEKVEPQKLDFVVRYDQTEPVLASSFFPSSPDASIIIGEDFFGDHRLSQSGVMRHALGHVMGYAHEHIGIEGCSNEPTPILPSSYDHRSVMHYLCGGGGTYELALSANDILSHRLVYGETTVTVSVPERQLSKVFPELLDIVATVEAFAPMVEFDPAENADCETYLETSRLSVAPGARNWVCRNLQERSDGSADIPLLRFRQSSNSIREVIEPGERAKGRDLRATIASVGPIHRNELRSLRDGDEYLVDWSTFETEFNLSDEEAVTILKRLAALKDDTPALDFFADDSIARNTAARQNIRTYSIIHVDPIDERHKICKGPTATDPEIPVGHYGKLFSPDFEYDIVELEGPDQNMSWEVPDISCAAPPEHVQYCSRECRDASSCSEPKCGGCADCRFDPDVLIVGDLFPHDAHAVQLPTHEEMTRDVCEISPAPLERNEDHSTHLASIISGRTRTIGWYHGKLLTSLTSNPEIDTDRLRRTLRDQSGVAVVATQFCLPRFYRNIIPDPDGDFQECNVQPEDRIDEDALAHLGEPTPRLFQYLNSNDSTKNWLWIVAMPHPVMDGQSVYHADSRMTPHQYGDESNFLVVTACDRCSTDRLAISERRVWPEAYNGERNTALWPRIAVPGGVDNDFGLPGLVVGGKMAMAGGTSQSAAIVGGLAAKMMQCYPHAYAPPMASLGDLKEALQIATVPIVPPPGGNPNDDHVATGVLDAKLALLHPDMIHLELKGLGTHRVSRLTDGFRWCAGYFDGSDGFQMHQIRSITKVKENVDGWVVYYWSGRGKINRSKMFFQHDKPLFSFDGAARGIEDVERIVMFDEPELTEIVCH